MNRNIVVSNELVIHVTSSEIVIALLEDRQLVEINKEKSNTQFAVGDIYLGKVRKIMGGLNAAFVDIGYEKDAFLHYLDLGPQFLSLNEYLKTALSSRNLPLLTNFSLKKDIDKNGKIADVLNVGQLVVVQIAKEPISTKGPRISSEISVAGRNLVLIPFSDKVSVSQKIKSSEERERLKKLILGIRPKNFGVIVRTVAKNRRVALLDAELRELIEKWETAFKQLFAVNSPRLIMGELNRTSAILRDMLNNSFNNIHIDNEAFFKEVKDYVTTIAPEQQKILKFYTGKLSIFEYFGIDKQIRGLFGKTVTIKNGAYLIIEHTEALHTVDVNSGNRSKKGDDQETAALEVNLNAAEEIARQLRLRDIGGIIVVDFIDMHSNENKQKVFEKMKESMATDRAKHNILPLSKFGLMQITRQRVRPETDMETVEVCPTCRGTGEILPSISFLDEIENNIKYITQISRPSFLHLKVHPYAEAFFKKGFFSKNRKWIWKFKMWIKITAIPSYSLLEYHFFDKRGEEIKL